MSRNAKQTRDSFAYFTPIQLRWGDFDLFHHVNNVAYYRYFEHIILTFYREHMQGVKMGAPVMTFVVDNGCHYIKPIDAGEYEDAGRMVMGALRVNRLGNSSVTYGLGLFAHDDPEPAAVGHWTHVFVAREDQRPIPIPDDSRRVLVDLAAKAAPPD